MDVCLISPGGAEPRAMDEVPSLLTLDESIVWLDILRPDEAALCLLGDELGFHPLALEDCAVGSPLPKVHVYGDHAFVILHSVEDGDGHARGSPSSSSSSAGAYLSPCTPPGMTARPAK